MDSSSFDIFLAFTFSSLDSSSFDIFLAFTFSSELF